MADERTEHERARAYVRRLQNPYASLQVQGYPDPDEIRDSAPVQLELTERAQVISTQDVPQGGDPIQLNLAGQAGKQTRLPTLAETQNPYATDQVDAVDIDAEPDHDAKQSASSTRIGTLSKRDFQAGCRRIFAHYIPLLEKGKLRAHHRDFITRNENRSPIARYGMLEELKKYDLSIIPGIRPHFNRERDLLTEGKLRTIEKLIDDEEE